MPISQVDVDVLVAAVEYGSDRAREGGGVVYVPDTWVITYYLNQDDANGDWWTHRKVIAVAKEAVKQKRIYMYKKSGAWRYASPKLWKEISKRRWDNSRYIPDAHF